MKAKFFMLAAAAFTLSLASCQKDEAPKGGLTSDLESAYAQVKISFGSTTRATTDGGYDKGTETESTIKSLTILLYDDAGALVGSGTHSETMYDAGSDANVAQKYDTKIVKVTMNPGNAEPAMLYAFVNATASYETEDEAKMAIMNAADIQGTDGFVMTNAGYYDSSDFVTGVAVTSDNLAATAELAKSAPVINIYVERLAAKISVSESADVDETSKHKFVGVDGTEYTLDFEAYKWAANSTAPDMYSFKQSTSKLDWATLNATNRYFWAEGTLYGEKYDDYVSGNLLDYISTQELIADELPEGSQKELKGKAMGGDDVVYVPEHTYGEAAKNEGAFEPKITGTSAIVAGQYVVKAGETPAEKFKNGELGYDFYLALYGAEGESNVYTIYTEEELINRMFAQCNVKVATENGGSEVGADFDASEYFKLSDKTEEEDGKYHLELTGNLFIGDGFTTAASSANFKATSNAAHYLNGWAYFLAPIEHNLADTVSADDALTTVGSYGVVRNHSYQLTVNSYKGLGAPLDESKIGEDPKNPDPTDPDEPIIPDPSEQKDAYINATLNVLGWHTIQQSVEF